MLDTTNYGTDVTIACNLDGLEGAQRQELFKLVGIISAIVQAEPKTFREQNIEWTFFNPWHDGVEFVILSWEGRKVAVYLGFSDTSDPLDRECRLLEWCESMDVETERFPM